MQDRSGLGVGLLCTLESLYKTVHYRMVSDMMVQRWNPIVLNPNKNVQLIALVKALFSVEKC